MMKRILFYSSVLFFVLFVGAFSSTATAQVGTLTGTVTDQRTGEALPGVNILVRELERGAATNIDGEYSISNIPFGTYNLRITSIGYRTLNQEIEVNSQNQVFDIELREDLVGLDEVVVTGQGSGVERRRLSTNVSSISARQMERVPTVQLDQLLQSNIPNSQVRLSSGSPGTAALIRGRGVTSALSSTTPVIYVDGVRVDNTTGSALSIGTGGAQSSAIADIPIENIERIEVVSGGAATTQFGSDAANGVIQIFTKQGVQGRSDFSFQSTLGAMTATKDYLRYDQTGDIIFSPGLIQEYRLSGSGGTETFTYSFSGSMREDEGVLQPGGDDQIRHSLRASFNAKVTESVSYNGSFGFSSSEFARAINANFSGSIFDIESGSFGNPEEWDNDDFEFYKDFIREYVGLMDIKETVRRFQTSHSLNFNIMDNLTAKAVVGLDFRNSGQRYVETNAYLIARGFVPAGTTDQGFMSEQGRDFLGLTLEASARHEQSFEDFSFVTNVGGQIFRNDELQVRATSDGLPDGSLIIGSGADTNGANFNRTVVNYGVYALENIGYKDKYFLELGLRGDQNTAFGEDVGIQWYPKFGLVYNISDESFFQNTFNNSISTLRIRASLGWAGNFPTPFSNEVLASVGSFQGAPVIEFGTPGDSNLKPERTRTFEVGSDISFVNDRFNFEVSYYESETTDALFSAPFARSVGLGTALQNLGVIENKGWEISSRFNAISTRDVSLTFNASFNTLTNTVIDNGGSAPFSLGGFAFLGSFVDQGKPVGYFRGGRPIFAQDGTLEEVIPNDDLGSPLPDYFGNLGVNADYKGLSLTVTADWQLGAQAVWPDEVLRWAGGLGDDRVPDNAVAPGGFFDLAGVWVEDADYLKVRVISLNYSVPERFYAGLVNRVSLGATATNPFNFVSSNFDPEVTGANIASGQGGVGVGGFSYRTLSAPRQFYGTLRVDF